MASPDALLAALAQQKGGLFHRDDAIAVGLDPRLLRRRVARDLLIERHPNVFQAATSPYDLEERERAALMALGNDALLSHDNASTRWGYGTPLPGGVIITIPWTRAHIRLEGVDIVRTRQYEGIKRLRNGWPLTCPPRTWIDLGRTRTAEELESALATGMQKKLLVMKEINLHLARSHNKAGTQLVRQVLPHFEEAWESRLSAIFGRLIAAASIALTPGYEISELDGTRLAIIDFADLLRKIAFEVDGWYYHGSKLQQQRDKARDRKLLRYGWITVRFTTDDILNRPDQVIAEIRAILAARAAA